MPDFLSLHDADQIGADAAPVRAPGFKNVVIGVLKHPHETLREALAHPVQAYALTFAALGGVYWAVNFSIAQGLGSALPLPALLAACAAAGIAGGIAYMYALSILLNWSCEILGGESARSKVRYLLALAGIPGLLALVLMGLPRLALFGQGLFMPDRPWLSANPALVWGLWFGDAIAFTWSMTLVIRGLKIMTGFSTGRALLAAALPAVPILLIGLLFLSIAWTGIFFAPPAF
jgi:hypothetical protein